MATKKEFEGKFEETGKNIDEMIADTQENFREEWQGLKDKWDEMNTKRSSLVDDSEDAWDDVKDEMEDGWKDIKDSYEDLKHKLSGNHEGHNH